MIKLIVLIETHPSHAKINGFDLAMLKIMVLTWHSPDVYKQTILTTLNFSHADTDFLDHNNRGR
jgi:hypothetical protein